MFRTVSLEKIELSRYDTRVQFNSSSNRFKFSTGIVYVPRYSLRGEQRVQHSRTLEKMSFEDFEIEIEKDEKL